MKYCIHIVVVNWLSISISGNQDFEDLSVNLQFLPEDTFKCVDITILDDGITEQPESFEVVISSSNFGVQIDPSRSRVRVVIIDGSFVGETYIIIYIIEHDDTIMLPFFLACTASEFECRQEAFCLPPSYVCDGIEDCLLSDDETQCDTSNNFDFVAICIVASAGI